MTIKKYECSLCKKFVEGKVKGIKRFIGTRKDVRKHLREEHGIKGRKNTQGTNKKDFGQSPITAATIMEEF